MGSGTTTAPAQGAVATTPTAGVFPIADDVESLIDKDVYGANGKEIGEINNLLIGPDGRVHAAIVEFGGFLGIGEHKVALPWDRLNVTNDRVTVNMTEDQVKAAPRWDKNSPGQFAEFRPLQVRICLWNRSMDHSVLPPSAEHWSAPLNTTRCQDPLF